MTLSRPLLAVLVVTSILAQLLISSTVAAQDDSETATVPTTSRSEEIVVAWDTFEDADTGLIEERPREPDDLRLAYDDGQFEIDALPDDFTGELAAPFGDDYTDVTLAVDAVLSSGTRADPGRYIFLSCRSSESGGYRMEYRPELPELVLRRVDEDDTTRLVSVDLDEAEYSQVDFPRRLELSCTGENIIARIDGREIASAVDSAHAEGALELGAGVYTISSGRVSADFDNMAVSVPIDMAPKPEPEIDRPAQMEPITLLREEAERFPPIAGPSAGAISYSAGSLDTKYAGVDVSDFVASVSFINPTDGLTDPWDFGIGFRQGDSATQWRIIVKSDATWHLAMGSELPRASGVVDNLLLDERAVNTLELLVIGNTGHFLVNDAFTAMFDLGELNTSGELWISTGFFPDTSEAITAVQFRAFTVWTLEEEPPPPTPTQAPQGAVETEPAVEPVETPAGTPIPAANPTEEALDILPGEGEEQLATIREDIINSEPDFGPDSGEVTQSLGAIDIESSGVEVENFYTRARFSNPASADDPEHSWDILIGFWHQGGDDQVRFVIASDGTWSAAEGTARPIVSGTATALNLGAARGNDIELAVVDGIGYLAINGEFIDSFEVPGSARPGDIWIASGTFPENVQEGVDTPFSDWAVWSLDE